MSRTVRVDTREALIAAAGSDATDLRVEGAIADLPTIRLAPGQSIAGDEISGGELRFARGADGVQLTADNSVCDLTVRTDPDRRAVFNDVEAPGLGRIALARLRVTGCVRLLAAGAARGGHVDAREVAIEAADARGFPERPAGFGVEVAPGVFTLWNRQEAAAALLTAELVGLSAGMDGAPVRGGGVFVGGTPSGGRTVVSRLHTSAVHSDGGIAPGTPDRISGGVFVVHGAWVDEVRNLGPTTTYGPNDMVLDNWGAVASWRAEAKVTSFGPSGIGFVNFGDLGTLRVLAAIETFGLGARGFNVYDGSLGEADFDRVVTHGAGAVGVQISRPVGAIVVRRGIETFGGVGPSLVKGVMTELPATAFSMKPGGSARSVTVEGGLVAHGEGVEAMELHGEVSAFTVSGGFGPRGRGFQGI